MRTSQAIASSQPPPKARPLTAAIGGDAGGAQVAHQRVRLVDQLRPLVSSICVNALMSAPAQNSSGLEEAMTSARTPEPLTCSQTLPRSSITYGAIEFIRPLASQAIATSPRVSSLTTSAWLLVVELRVGVEALAGLLAEAALGDEAADDQRRGEALAVLLLGRLEALEQRVQALHVGLHERREQAAAGVQAGAGHHRDVDVAVGRDALLEHAGRPRRTS